MADKIHNISFTFYCSSIKISLVITLSSSRSHLHSTVVLLKARNGNRIANVEFDLHSTVVLLKGNSSGAIFYLKNLFTFYCSSIKAVYNIIRKENIKDLHSTVVLLKEQ